MQNSVVSIVVLLVAASASSGPSVTVPGPMPDLETVRRAPIVRLEARAVARPALASPVPVFRVIAADATAGEWAVWCRTGEGPGNTAPPVADTPLAGSAGCDGLDSPVAAVRQLLAAYAVRSPELCAAVLADDYRFWSNDPMFTASSPEGLDRDGEIRVLEHMATGFIRPDGVQVPRVTRVRLEVRSFESAPSAGASGRFEVVARGVRLWMETEAGDLSLEECDHTFEVVAARASEAPAPFKGVFSDGLWQVRRWRADEAGAAPIEALAASAEKSATELDGNSEPVIALGMRRLSALREWPILIELSLPADAPARLRIFDVAGRCVRVDALARPGPGRRSHSIADPALHAGVYFARLEQGREMVVMRVVVLR